MFRNNLTIAPASSSRFLDKPRAKLMKSSLSLSLSRESFFEHESKQTGQTRLKRKIIYVPERRRRRVKCFLDSNYRRVVLILEEKKMLQ